MEFIVATIYSCRSCHMAFENSHHAISLFIIRIRLMNDYLRRKRFCFCPIPKRLVMIKIYFEFSYYVFHPVLLITPSVLRVRISLIYAQSLRTCWYTRIIYVENLFSQKCGGVFGKKLYLFQL